MSSSNTIFFSVRPMKWLGNGGGVPEGDGIMKSNMDSMSSAMGGPQRTQDDAAVGYVFQRPPDPEFPPFGPKQLRWAHGDDTIIEVSCVYYAKHIEVSILTKNELFQSSG